MMMDDGVWWVNPADLSKNQSGVKVIEFEKFNQLTQSSMHIHNQLIAYRHAMKDINKKMLLNEIEQIKNEIQTLVSKVLEENPKCKT